MCGCVCVCACVCVRLGVQKMNFVQVGKTKRGFWLLYVCANGRESG